MDHVAVRGIRGLLNLGYTHTGVYFFIDIVNVGELTSLINKGYIIKQPSSENKRVSYILLTKKGIALVESAELDMNLHLESLKEEMGEERFDMLILLVQEANEVLERKQKGSMKAKPK